MAFLVQIIAYLIDTFAGLYFLAVLLRFVLQLVRADFYNPISQGLVRLTNSPIKIFRRIIPGIGGIDVASLVVAALVKILTLSLLLLLYGKSTSPIHLIIWWPLLYIAATIFNIFYIALIASMIISFVAQGSYHPLVILSQQISQPIFAPLQRLIPPMGGLDFSPMLAIPIFYVIQMILSFLAVKTGLEPNNLFGIFMLRVHGL